MVERNGVRMSEAEKEKSQHPYDNWKAITESDFVTLFIKTWFAFVATLRELYPENRPYYLAAGDSPLVSSYKKDFCDDIHFLCSYDAIEENLCRVYKYGLRMISTKYPRFLQADFYQINESFKESYSEPFESIGGYSGTLSFQIKSSAGKKLKASVKCSDDKFSQKTGNSPVVAVIEFDYGTFLEDLILAIEQEPTPISENGLGILFYTFLFQILNQRLTDEIERRKKELPEKGNKNIHKLFDLIRAFCVRASDAIKNSCLNASIGDNHKLLSQVPFTEFLQKKGTLTTAENQRAYLWFVSFVYRLRNALFHEIIDPLDSEWQIIFKNAYLVLKQIVDANIARLKMVSILMKTAPLIVEKDFRDSPPPKIPIADYLDTSFLFSEVKLMRYTKEGVKIHVKAEIICNSERYNVDCNVRWDEKIENPTVKNVQIEAIKELVSV